jgi:hypothetical protein
MNTAGIASTTASTTASTSGSGYKQEEESCQVEYKQNGNSPAKYTPVSKEECDVGLVCNVFENDDGTNGVLDGKCELEAYAGQGPDRTRLRDTAYEHIIKLD